MKYINGRIFIDTNIWLYAFMDDADPKKEKALDVISEDTSNITLSTQVLIEISVNLIKKAGYREEELLKLTKSLAKIYKVLILDEEVIWLSSKIRRNYKISFWDSLIIASALSAGCTILYTEDMQHNQIIDGTLKIVNPFL